MDLARIRLFLDIVDSKKSIHHRPAFRLHPIRRQPLHQQIGKRAGRDPVHPNEARSGIDL